MVAISASARRRPPGVVSSSRARTSDAAIAGNRDGRVGDPSAIGR
jgi:hypothetical protein